MIHPKTLPLCLALVAGVCLLYGGFLDNPPVFDDEGLFDDAGILRDFGGALFHFSLRWLPYATFGWTNSLAGPDMFWLRCGNLLLHAANAVALFAFLRLLFEAVSAGGGSPAPPRALPATWFAFFAALIFALHPVVVYGAAYLIQRSILMATLFSLLALLAYLQGLTKNRPLWFVAAAACYFLAVFSKEHSIMLPGVALALTLLLRAPSPALLKQLWLPFALFAVIGVAAILKAKGILGLPYEPSAREMFMQLSESRGTVDAASSHPLSALTQSLLFFKYLALWAVPCPCWMSIDMREPFALHYLAWPHTAGAVGFVLYGAAAIRLLLARGTRGLLGFALLFPWILFMTELAAIRIQEPFVLYRSYLWMPGVFAALPVLLGRLRARHAGVLLLAVGVLLFPLSWNRLTTFSDPLLLWGDAEKLVHGNTNLPGADRIYYNRGTYYGEHGLRKQAIDDLNKAIEISPRNTLAYGNRAAAYYEEGQFVEAIRDFDRTIAMNPRNAKAYLGRGLSHEALGNRQAALPDLRKSCELGLQWACDRLGQP